MSESIDFWSLLYVFVLATFIGLGVIRRVSRLLHTPLMSLTNAISGIAVVGAILVTGGDYPTGIRIMGAIALFASMTNIVSGFLITDRMLKMFKTDRKPKRTDPLMTRSGPARLPRRDRAVHLRAPLDERAGHGPPGRVRRRGGHGHRHRGNLGPAGGGPPPLDRPRDHARGSPWAFRSRGCRSPPCRSEPRCPTRSAAWPPASSARPSTTSGIRRARSISRRSG